MNIIDDTYEGIQSMIADERYDEATAALEDYVCAADCRVSAYYDLGNLYYTTGKKQKALAQYEKAAQLEPDNPIYLKNLADLLYAETDDVTRVLEIYEKILSSRPDDIQILLVKGHICVSINKFPEAAQCYRKALDIEPWNLEAQTFLDKLGSKVPEVQSGQTAEDFYSRCQKLIASGHIEKAIEGLSEITKIKPDFSLAHNDLGVLYYRQGDKVRCLQHYEKAIAIDPDNVNYKKNIADFYFVEMGDVEKALELYASVLNEDPEDIDSLMIAGRICESMGKKNSAMLFYERALDIEPWNLLASERIDHLNSLQASN